MHLHACMQDNDHTIEADPFARESTESSEVELSPLASLDPRAWPVPSAGRFAMRGPTCNFSEIGVLRIRAQSCMIVLIGGSLY